MPIARCPVCEDVLTLGSELALSHPVTCSTCLSNLKVVSLEPCELEEANRRPPRYQGGQPFRSNPQGGRRDQPAGRPVSNAPGNNQPQGAPQDRDRRLPAPRPLPAFPPNPDKQVDTRRAQKWEKPKENEAEPEEVDGYDEFEDKFNRNRGGKKRK